MLQRPRRLRENDVIRRMVRETRMDPSSLIYPMFVMDGENAVEPIPSLPGQYRYTVDRMDEKLESLMSHGVNAVMFFGIPAVKDEVGSQAYAPDGIVQRAMTHAKENFPDLYVIGDVCMCEYTSHGHCGILHERVIGNHEAGKPHHTLVDVDNDPTIKLMAKIAVSQARAGADMVAPSDMMDGRVLAIRNALDAEGFTDIPIMSYAVKYASAFYGPFRDAAGSAPAFGDRRSYQMDYHNIREAIKEAKTDVEEGADIIMVKPAMSFLDVVARVHDAVDVPIATYSVSGEYAMVKSAAAAGMIDEKRIISEMAVGAYRAGAGIYITYFAEELADLMREGYIG